MSASAALVRSLPLEGSQPFPRGERNGRRGARFAHYPWRDRNAGLRRGPAEDPRVRSLPLEGSQRLRVHRADRVMGFAHYPWRDRNSLSSASMRRSRSAFAHYPWRDRNIPSRMEPIMTMRFAHYPWRDRNVRPYGCENYRGHVRSLPLEGSQLEEGQHSFRLESEFAHYPWRDRNARPDDWVPCRTARVRSLPLEGSQHGDAHVIAASESVRSLPLEGSQLSGQLGELGIAPCSLITPGGIATWSQL